MQTMQAVTWNYAADPEVSPLCELVKIYLDFRTIPGNWDPDWTQRRIGFYQGSRELTDQQAAAKLVRCPVVSWVHPYHTSGVKNAPKQFSQEDVNGHEALVRQARGKLLAGGASPQLLRHVKHVLDFENDGPRKPSKFPDGFPVNVPHLATCCYLFGEALRAANWKQSRLGGVANYATNSTGQDWELGGPPYYRASPYWVPGSLNADTICISGYSSGGPFGCLTEAEMMDCLYKLPGPFWLVLEDNNPGLLTLIRAAKKSGKVSLLLLWGNGLPEPDAPGFEEYAKAVGDRHRDFARGGSRAWAKNRDALIWEAVAS